MRRQLALVVAAVTAMVVIAFVVPLAGAVQILARDRALSAAEREAQTLAQALGAFLPEAGPDGVRNLLGSGRSGDLRISAIMPNGEVIGFPVSIDEDVDRARAGAAFRVPVPEGEVIYVPVFQSAEEAPVVVRVFVPDETLGRNVTAAWTVLGVLGILLILLAAAVGDRLGRSMVRPVQQLSAGAHQLSEGNLSVRVEPSGPPELVEVAQAFNRLGSRIDSLLAEEREAAADLSHRLRTPLTALRLEVESLRDPDEAERMLSAVADLEREVDHLIYEARRPLREGTGAASDLSAIIRERVEFWGVLAEEQGRRWELRISENGLMVAMPRVDLVAAIDALLENVLAHTREGTRFAVSVGRNSDGGCRLVVEDDGPGYPSDDVLARGESAAGSTGLGLDIVRRTAEATGGSVTLGTNQSGGARIVVDFGTVD